MLEPMTPILYAAFLLFASNATSQPIPTVHQISVVTGKVVGVSDGDTITVFTAAKERMRVRLAEIDAPESNQDYGTQSKKALSDLCFGKAATVTISTKDRYDRFVGRVTCDGTDAHAHMVRTGMAWVYERYAKDKSLMKLQEHARSQRVGLWSQANPIAPWDFRKGSR